MKACVAAVFASPTALKRLDVGTQEHQRIYAYMDIDIGAVLPLVECGAVSLSSKGSCCYRSSR
eukprot:80820-Amphidinium_carterae.1